MKVESIPFRCFMAKDYQKQRSCYSPSTLYSVNTIVSFGSLLSPPPVIANAYLFMFAVGAVTIGLAACEKLFISRELLEIATSVVNLFKAIMPFALIAVLVYFVYGNPLL